MKLSSVYVAVDRTETELYAESGGRLFNLSARIPGVVDVSSLLRRSSLQAAAEALEDAVADVEGVDANDVTLAPTLTSPRSIVCIGRNYPEHNKEGKVPAPEFPLLFSKFPNTLRGSNEAVPNHAITSELDYEGELALVIGRTASRVSAAAAMSFVAGYTVINDISARDLQEGDNQWIRGKSLDGFCPIGPSFVTADEIEDPYDLVVRTTVNGEVRQEERCAEMIYKIPELLAFITEGITLRPGDLVATGTPSGTGIGFDPPKYLSSGDRVEVTIDPIGTLTSTID